ncbi:O-antigen polymerase [Deinococcus sp. PESE-13]
MTKYYQAQHHSLSFLLLLLGLSGFVPLLLAFQTIPSGLAWLPYLLAIYAGYRLALAGSRLLAPMSISFWTFIYVFFGVTAFLQVSARFWPWPDMYSSEEILTAYIILFLGILARDAGSIIAKRLTHYPKMPSKPQDTSKLLLPLLLGLCLLSLATIPFLGGLGAVLGTRGDVGAATQDLEKSSGLILNTLLHVPAFTALLIFIVSSLRSNKILLTFLILINLLVNFPPALTRFWLGSMLISIILVLFPINKQKSYVWVLGLLTVLLLLFPYADFTRRQSQQGLAFSQTKITDIYIRKGDYDAFQMVLNMNRYVNLYGNQSGENLLGSLLFFVPRSVWPAKPYGTGQVVADRLGYRFLNLSAPLWGEGFVAFGYLGVVLLLFLYGMISFWLNQAYLIGGQSWLFLVASFMGGFNIMLLRGDLQNAVAYSSPVIVILSISWTLVRRRKQGLRYSLTLSGKQV